MKEAVTAIVARVHGIVSHLEMHDDEFMARWFLRTFGEKLFPGIRNAMLILVDSGIRLLRGKTGAEWFAAGYPCLGTCGGPLDEHDLPPEERKNASAATLTAKILGIGQYPPILTMLAHTVRVDRTATASSFDISAIIKAMHRNGVPIAQMCRMYDRIADAWFTVLSGKVRNAAWKERPTFDQLTAEWIVNHLTPEGYDRSKRFATAFEAADDAGLVGVRALRPLLDYLVEEEKRSINDTPAKDRLFELNGTVDALNQDGATEKVIREIVFTALEAKLVEQIRFCEGLDELKTRKKNNTLYTKGSKWSVIRVVSDNPEINRAARYLDPHHDIFIQRNTDGHMVIWYNTKLNMDEAVARLRASDRAVHWMTKRLPWNYLKTEGTLPEAPWWYYNPANGQIMCGSRTNRGTPVTRLDDNAVIGCIARGLESVEKSKAS